MKRILFGFTLGAFVGLGGGAFAAWNVRPVYDDLANQWNTVQLLTSNPLKLLPSRSE